MEPKIINLMKLFTGEFLLLKLLMDLHEKTDVKFFTYETDDGKICFIAYDLK